MPDFCGVEWDSDFDGTNEFYSETNVARARKEHLCEECRGPIAAGASYVRVAGRSDGDFWTRKVCAPCMALIKEFADGGSWSFGELWDVIRDAWSAGSSLQGCINRVSSVAEKTKLRDEWMKWKGLAGNQHGQKNA